MPLALNRSAKRPLADDLVEVQDNHGRKQLVSLSELRNIEQFPTLLPLRNRDGSVIGAKIGLCFYIYRHHIRKVKVDGKTQPVINSVPPTNKNIA